MDEDLTQSEDESSSEYFNRLFPEREHEPLDNPMAGMTDDEKLVYLLQKEGRTWHCEDAIKPALNAFVDTMGEEYYPRAERGRSTLYASARTIVAEIGEAFSEEFVRWACKRAKQDLTIKSLYSIEYLIPEFRKKIAERQYFEEPFEEPEMVECPRCGKWIFEEHIEMDCKGH
jgi:hypothetical protein